MGRLVLKVGHGQFDFFPVCCKMNIISCLLNALLIRIPLNSEENPALAVVGYYVTFDQMYTIMGTNKPVGDPGGGARGPCPHPAQ